MSELGGLRKLEKTQHALESGRINQLVDCGHYITRKKKQKESVCVSVCLRDREGEGELSVGGVRERDCDCVSSFTSYLRLYLLGNKTAKTTQHHPQESNIFCRQ